MEKQTETRSERKKPRRKLKISRIILLSLSLVLFLAGGIGLGFLFGAIKNMPEWDPTKLSPPETSFIFDVNGQQVSKLHTIENREEVKISQMPANLKNAFIATEDEKFYAHHGVRLDAVARAVVANIVDGWGSEGGSTITIQLVNHAFFNQSKEKKLERKIQEVILAVQLERKYTKDEILEMYLNRIYFNGGAYGVQTASQYYYNKNVEDLELHECALLAGLVKSPARYSPYKNPDAAKDRRTTVLNRMVVSGYISESQANAAKDKPLTATTEEKTEPATTANNDYQYFLDYVIDSGASILEGLGVSNPEASLFNQGYRIYTTLDPTLQKYLEEVYANDKNFPAGNKDAIVQSAAVFMNAQTGGVSALIGGRKYDVKRGFNRAVSAVRQPGSAFKPIAVFAPALAKGFGPDTVLADSPVTYNLGGTNWSPKNYDNTFRGNITMRTAVQLSVNIYPVKLLELMGTKTGLDFAQEAGITTLVTSGAKNDNTLSLALGGLTHGVTPLEMAGAYAIFADQGKYKPPHVITNITDRNGKTIYQRRIETESRQVMTPANAYIMTSLLQSVMVSPGTGARVSLSRPNAGKTGTTSDDTNAWFAGYTPDMVGIVWMGFDSQNQSMKGVYGSNHPGTIWKMVMNKAHEGKPVRPFPQPEGINLVEVCKASGKIPNGLCPASSITQDFFAKGSGPTGICDVHVTAEVCAESGKLANAYCPTRLTSVAAKSAGTCTIHGPDSGQTNTEANSDGPDNPNDPTTSSPGNTPGSNGNTSTNTTNNGERSNNTNGSANNSGNNSGSAETSTEGSPSRPNSTPRAVNAPENSQNN